MPESANDEKVIEGVAIGNLKSISEQPAMLSNLAYSNAIANNNLTMQNAVANQQTLNETGVAVLGKTVNEVSNLGPLESKSSSEILSGNTIAEQISALKASVQAFAEKGGAGASKSVPSPSRAAGNAKDNPMHVNAPFYLVVDNVEGPDTITIEAPSPVPAGQHPKIDIMKK